jgi:transketolase
MLRKPSTKNPQGPIVLQGSEVAYAFVETALPMLLKEKIDIAVYYIASAELFDLLPEEEQEKIFPEKSGQEAMGISGFTLPTMYRWIQSSYGRQHTLYPFRKGHFLGSGKAESVIAEAGLDGESQFKAILAFIKGQHNKKSSSTEVHALIPEN